MEIGPIVGNVTLEDANPPAADYTPARKAIVTFSFQAVDQDELATIADHASTLAIQQINKMLGRQPVAAVQPGEADKPATRVRSKKVEAAPPASSEPSDATAGSGGSDPFAMGGEPEESPEVAAERARIAAELNGDKADTNSSFTPNDDPFTITPEEVVKEISDADLNAAVTKKNTEIGGDAARIKALIAKYNPDPSKVFQLREIAPAQRQDFLDKLAQLKKAA